MALELPELSPHELAVRFTDENKYFVSEASVYRLLKAHDLITGLCGDQGGERVLTRYIRNIRSRCFGERASVLHPMSLGRYFRLFAGSGEIPLMSG
jgi:hypothetical protein